MAGRSNNFSSPSSSNHCIDPTENLKKVPSKGILKQSSSFDAQEGPSTGHKLARTSKETKWDEMNIIATLHPPGKDYGHMKIDEPKTPYEKNYCDETDTVDPQNLAERLKGTTEKPEESPEPSSEDESEDELTPEERAKKKSFEAKRKAHYNEFIIAKRALKNLVEEEDEEEEGKDVGERQADSPS